MRIAKEAAKSTLWSCLSQGLRMKVCYKPRLRYEICCWQCFLALTPSFSLSRTAEKRLTRGMKSQKTLQKGVFLPSLREAVGEGSGMGGAGKARNVHASALGKMWLSSYDISTLQVGQYEAAQVSGSMTRTQSGSDSATAVSITMGMHILMFDMGDTTALMLFSGTEALMADIVPIMRAMAESLTVQPS